MHLRTAPITIAAAAALAAGGCGGASSSAPGTAGTDGTDAAGAVHLRGTGPVDTEISIDRTAIMANGTTVAREYRTAALAAAEPTITRGGTIAVSLFGSVGAHPLNVYSDEVPPLATEGAADRGPGENQRRATLGLMLDYALGLKPAPAAMAARISAVTRDRGSDIARSLGARLERARQGSSPVKLVVLLSDGLLDQRDLLLRGHLSKGSVKAVSNAIVRQIDARGDGPKVTLVRIAGIGQTAGGRGTDGVDTPRLRAIWRSACEALPAERCEVDPEVL